MDLERIAIVIIGASGDLAGRKLIPALEALYNKGKICSSCIILGCGRTFFTDEQFRERFRISADFANHIFYHQYVTGLKQYLQTKGEFSRIVIFLSQPPTAYMTTIREIAADGFGQEASLVIEKPFGYDQKSAAEMNRELSRYFTESQIFRIDHYLAKESVQNIMIFRFANTAFLPAWNSHYIESIQINAIENIGIADRGGYFDKAGIIRDMVQNHLLQLLCLITMDTPSSLDHEDIRQQKLSVLKNIKIEECHRFQYEGYLQEKGVDPESKTETFAELRLFINNMRWAGMPVYIRCGKAVHRKGIEIGITYRSVPAVLYNHKNNLEPNRIIFKIQPSEGIILHLMSKVPGTDQQITGTHMNFCYRDSFHSDIPDAYQRLLYDVFRGDHTLFVSANETEAQWKIVEPVLDKGDIIPYKFGHVPQSRLNVAWIDFDSYTHFCA